MDKIMVAFLSKKDLKKVNRALTAAGWLPYPGDRTPGHPEGCGAGFVGNLVDWLAPVDHWAREGIVEIVKHALDEY